MFVVYRIRGHVTNIKAGVLGLDLLKNSVFVFSFKLFLHVLMLSSLFPFFSVFVFPAYFEDFSSLFYFCCL